VQYPPSDWNRQAEDWFTGGIKEAKQWTMLTT